MSWVACPRSPGLHHSEVREAGAYRGWPVQGARGFIIARSARPAHIVGGLPKEPGASSASRPRRGGPAPAAPAPGDLGQHPLDDLVDRERGAVHLDRAVFLSERREAYAPNDVDSAALALGDRNRTRIDSR